MEADLIHTNNTAKQGQQVVLAHRVHTGTDMASLKTELSRAPGLAPSPLGNMGQERERKQIREDTQ